MKTYRVPAKVIALVRKDPSGLLALMQDYSGQRCPLQVIAERSSTPSSDGEGRPEPSVPLTRCYALQGDPKCYLDSPSHRGRSLQVVYQPQVGSKEDCPVYQAVMGEMERLQRSA